MSHCDHVGRLCDDTRARELNLASIANQVRGVSMADRVRGVGAVVFFRDAKNLDENLSRIVFCHPLSPWYQVRGTRRSVQIGNVRFKMGGGVGVRQASLRSAILSD